MSAYIAAKGEFVAELTNRAIAVQINYLCMELLPHIAASRVSVLE
jgi:hypothetical protein